VAPFFGPPCKSDISKTVLRTNRQEVLEIAVYK